MPVPLLTLPLDFGAKQLCGVVTGPEDGKGGVVVTKAELVEKVVEDVAHRELSKAAVNEVVDSVFDNIAKAVRKDKRFTYPGFGTFSVRTRKARVGRNPQTGEEIKIKASKTVGFKPAPVLKETL